ncbi:hypothetical protein ElyMa_000880100 [Elysia marginata]|uniref:THAP-type domain-containing protein n=1 Tax=Elysia marginata TaxID=1093978 RepID=A0AAV4H5W3_9GAST|nr:hypothetical protein ElyMa_000880100 [Elysia marginata]
MPSQTDYRTCPELIQSSTLIRAIDLEAKESSSRICLNHKHSYRTGQPPPPIFTIFTADDRAKKWHETSTTTSTQRKGPPGRLDGCDD